MKLAKAIDGHGTGQQSTASWGYLREPHYQQLHFLKSNSLVCNLGENSELHRSSGCPANHLQSCIRIIKQTLKYGLATVDDTWFSKVYPSILSISNNTIKKEQSNVQN